VAVTVIVVGGGFGGVVRIERLRQAAVGVIRVAGGAKERVNGGGLVAQRIVPSLSTVKEYLR
jgi:hypothetical protein